MYSHILPHKATACIYLIAYSIYCSKHMGANQDKIDVDVSTRFLLFISTRGICMQVPCPSLVSWHWHAKDQVNVLNARPIPPLKSVHRLCNYYLCAKLYCKLQSVMSVVGKMLKSLCNPALPRMRGFTVTARDEAAVLFLNVPFALLHLL